MSYHNIYWNQRNFGMIAALNRTSFGLQADGTILKTGDFTTDTASMTNIVQIHATQSSDFIGITQSGQALAVGGNVYGRINIENWPGDLIQVNTGQVCSIGLRENGTVVHAGVLNYSGDPRGWTDIKEIALGDNSISSFILGLKQNGTVQWVVSEHNSTDYGHLTGVESWTDIIHIAAAYRQSYGLKADGTVVAAGENNSNVFQVTGETNIVKIAAARDKVAVLRANGTVGVYGNPLDESGNVQDWTDIVDIAVSRSSTIGLKADGSMVGAGQNTSGRYDFSAWEISTGQYYEIEGITTIDGAPASMELRAYEAQTGAIQIKGQSDATGAYSLKLPRWYNAYVMTVPPPGHRPEVHGPIIRPDELDITPAP